MEYNFYTTDVFTNTQFGGNPLAVFPEAAGLSDEQMQLIAREFNLSETIFMFPPEDAAHTYKVRIFTPNHELPFAGHPTVGGAYVLATMGFIKLDGAVTEIVFEEGVGPVPIKIFADDAGNVAKAELSAAVIPEIMQGAPSAEALEQVLSLDSGDVLSEGLSPVGGPSPVIVKAGTPRLFAPVKDRAALGRISIDAALWRKHLGDTRSIYVFCTDPELEDSDLRGRMFVGPASGLYEDPATGSAVTALAAYLATLSDIKNGTLRWVMEQGFEMGRPSILEMEADLVDGASQAIRVAGSSVMVSKGTFFV
ncbi:MAG: PhzF family phenazine biosynthesis protein [Anaerolineae bacterium]